MGRSFAVCVVLLAVLATVAADTALFVSQEVKPIETICISGSSGFLSWFSSSTFLTGTKADLVDGVSKCANNLDFQAYSSDGDFSPLAQLPRNWANRAWNVSVWQTRVLSGAGMTRFNVGNYAPSVLSIKGLQSSAVRPYSDTSFQVRSNRVKLDFATLPMLQSYIAINRDNITTDGTTGAVLVQDTTKDDSTNATQRAAFALIQPLGFSVFSFFLYEAEFIPPGTHATFAASPAKSDVPPNNGRKLLQTAEEATALQSEASTTGRKLLQSEESSYLQAIAAACPGGYCYPNPNYWWAYNVAQGVGACVYKNGVYFY
eukprot:jgi/Mesen1/1185/ME000127S00222